MIDTLLPKAVSEGTLKIGSVTIRTYVLEDGRRIINAEDADALFAAWASGEQMSPAEADALASFLRQKMARRSA